MAALFALIWVVVGFFWSILPDGLADVLTYLLLGIGALMIGVVVLAGAVDYLGRAFLGRSATRSRPGGTTPKPRPRPTAPRRTKRQRERCDTCDKDIFTTEAEAWDAVQRSQRRFQEGQPGTFDVPLNHAYCGRACRRWHVSSKPRY